MRPVMTPLRAIVGLLVIALLGGCSRNGPTQTVNRSVDLDDADSIAVDLHISAGELHVTGGASRLMEGTFRFNVPEWEPMVDYRRDGTRGVLKLNQPSFRPSFGNHENSWDLRFTDRVPIALTATVGAGESSLVLGTLNLQGLQVDVGAGETTIDLRGRPAHSYDVRVNASVGQANILLPRTVAIVANASAGVGGVNVSGLEKQGDRWINPGHEQDPIAIRLEVHGGVGEIRLSAE